MTHDELLKKVTNYDVYVDGTCDGDIAYKALRKVVELHRPEKQEHKEYEKCWNCNLMYPCPTIQAIEKELA